MQPRQRMLLGFILANGAIAAVAATLFLSRPIPPPQIQGVLLPEARALAPFTLTDHRGDTFSNGDLEGRWHLVSYGFTTCPDVCPATLAELASFRSRLQPELRRDLQVLFYSVDHRRDTPEQLASYVSFFDPSFTGLTATDGGEAGAAAFADSLGILSVLEPAAGTTLEDGDYQVSHGVTLLLLNPAGKLQAVLEPGRVDAMGFPGFDIATLVRDYTAIRNYLRISHV
ncbi:SCO family protein [Haliea sp. E1-2-M8]|uniref:SCO family protein n=1 Tax=Haliea sp. E1-2-M8 TaxID=3064706 RepID=UPI002727F349|nr:SCO family protein [Haliea sp. E1-2-M8]MDO8860358.1 SCO family protein [Haliea sp. E1-2-M8]